ncbi:MAG TPA: sodium-dependent transporter, partial [Methanomicrobia archaeon]|nr:sodium-dependent transporter [Methanomicrobia archaeon]
LTIGIPLYLLELAIGQRQQCSAPGAWAKMNKRFEGVGWWGLGVSFFLVLYFSAIVAWVYDYLYYSLGTSWAGRAEEFFFQDVLSVSSGPADISGMSIPVAVALVVTWISIYLTLFKGLDLMSKVLKVTVPLPLILLVILMIRGITLDGGIDGIGYYLSPDFSALASPTVWVAAYTQVFFSVGVGMSILIAYASNRYVHSEITRTSIIVSMAEMLISFMAGFVVFSILGYLALAQGVGIPEVVRGGAELAFVAFPTAIELMPVATALFGVMFFITLLTLAHSSAISFVKAISDALTDQWGWSLKKTSAVTCTVLCAASLFFATNAGFYWVEILDHFANNYGVAAVCLVEVIFIGWASDPEELRRWISSISYWRLGRWWVFIIRYFAPTVITGIIALSAYEDFVARIPDVMSYPVWTTTLTVLAIVALVPFLSLVVLPRVRRVAGCGYEKSEQPP